MFRFVEAFVEEELAEVAEGGEEERVECGVGGARWVWSVVRNVSETELGDVDCYCCIGFGIGIGGEVVASDAMWGGGAEVIGVE